MVSTVKKQQVLTTVHHPVHKQQLKPKPVNEISQESQSFIDSMLLEIGINTSEAPSALAVRL